MCIGMYFALVHQALFVVVQKLDGILDSDHVLFTFSIDLVEHGGERGGFAGTRRASNEHQSAGRVPHAAPYGRQPQGIEAFDLPWNGAKHGAHRAALIEDVASEAR